MKKITVNSKSNVMCLFIMYMVLIVGCTTGSAKKSSQTKTNDSTSVVIEEETPHMSGWKSYGLSGRVKSVMYESGNYFEFNMDGNVVKTIKIIDPETKNTKTYTYSSPTEYTIHYEDDYSCEGNITYDGKERTETIKDDCLSRNIYTFDDNDRVLNYVETSDCDGYYKMEFKYDSPSDLLPSEAFTRSGEEDLGSIKETKYAFSYLEKDAKGNWTKRSVTKNITLKEDIWNEETQKLENQVNNTIETFVEKRTIEYF